MNSPHEMYAAPSLVGFQKALKTWLFPQTLRLEQWDLDDVLHHDMYLDCHFLIIVQFVLAYLVAFGCFYVVLYSVRHHELLEVGWHQNQINPILNFLPISFMDNPQSEHYDQDML